MTAGGAGSRIRPAVAADLEAVLDLWRTSGAKPSPTDDIAGLRTLVAHDAQALLVAEDGGEIVGSLIVGFDGWRANLYRLAVRPSHRRRGLARALVLTAVDLLRARGGRRVSAFVVSDDADAVAFWTSLERDGLRRDPSKTRWILAIDGPPSTTF